MITVFPRSLLATAALFLMVLTAQASDFVTQDALKGTIWVAQSPHDRTTVTPKGEITVKQGKEIYLEFLDLIDGVYTVKIHWWNVSHNINVVEYAVMVPRSENLFVYSETEHPEDSGFPGIQGHGSFRLIDYDTAELSQVGHLLDGSASAFITILKRADKRPEVPIPQTYPKPD